MKTYLYYQQQSDNWIHYQTKHNENDAYRVAKLKSQQMGKRYFATFQKVIFKQIIYKIFEIPSHPT